MRPLYVAAMDKLYVLCVAVCVVSVVIMTGFIFTGVVMRYVFHVGAQFAEPLSIFFAVQLTMYGAAACFRVHAHLRLQVFVKLLSERLQRMADALVLILMGSLALFMVVYGISLTSTTWFQAYPEFVYIRVGFVYSAIPGSGLVTLLFVLEAAFYRKAVTIDEEAEMRHALEHGEEEARRLTI